VERLKDARTSAAKEIEEYRRLKEQEFAAFQSSVSHVVPDLTLNPG
jgi:V-type H+-transporting ATPase subunit G